MSGALYFCCNDRRRSAIEGRSDINGIDFLEVLDDPSQPLADRQRTLFIHFINDPGALVLARENVTIRGGEREEYRDPRVVSAQIAVDPRSGSTRPVLVVVADKSGDFSTYTLTLAPSGPGDTTLDAFDHVLRAIDFSFKTACESKFDCGASNPCPPPAPADPAIDYLARDFRSLRQVMIDRISMLVPGWRDRTPADFGVAIVELLAFVGDYLSYRQDAVGTEAYLDTARRRVSVRRLARLVDYHMHSGANARTWLQLQVSNSVTIPAQTQVLTQTPGLGSRVDPDSQQFLDALAQGALAFSTMHAIRATPALNSINFYTWGARACCLPKGAVRATLIGHLPPEADPANGVFLLFEELISPRTGNAGDANPGHRHVVRLREVERTVDRLGGLFTDSPAATDIEITNISWDEEDALPFPLCISATRDPEAGGNFEPVVSVARGNVVAADHGLWVENQPLGVVPASTLRRVPAKRKATSECSRVEFETVPPRFRPAIELADLSNGAAVDTSQSAYAITHWDKGKATPQITLRSTRNGQDVQWSPRRDLIESDAIDPVFAVEPENDGRVYLRFGDGTNGMRPVAGESFSAAFRAGNGPEGNVGARTLSHIAMVDPAILSVTNPIPATGGTSPESIESVRNSAPFAFRTQKRAVTLADYAKEAGTHREVQKAAATQRWTGSWYTTFISVDRRQGLPIDAPFRADIARFLSPVRLAGHDVEVESPRFVSLEMALIVQVHPDYSRSDIRTALASFFSNQGLFHPDRFTFGQSVFLSPLLAAVQNLEGVDSVDITLFQRQDTPGPKGIEDGKLTMSRLEIARLDNDPNFPGRGTAVLDVRGGR